MAEEFNSNADILGNLLNTTASIDSKLTTAVSTSETQLEYLKSIESKLDAFVRGASKMSQSGARDFGSRDTYFRDTYSYRRTAGRGSRVHYGSFFDEFEKGLLDGLIDADVKSQVKDALDKFTGQFGASIKDLPGMMGKAFAQQAMDKFKDTSLGRNISEGLNNLAKKFTDKLSGATARAAGGSTSGFAAHAAREAASGHTASATASQAASAAASAGTTSTAIEAAQSAELTTTMAEFSEFSSIIAEMNPYMLAIMAALYVLEPLLDGVSKLFKGLLGAGNRYEDQRKKFLELSKRRIEADIQTLVTQPFEVLKQAVNAVTDVWDSNLRVIAGTQGYDKASVQTLWANISQRLQAEGLSSVISSSDVLSNLTKVLSAGLQGDVATEFAYQATRLGAAIPTEDFFSYASAYAEIAANAIRQGKSQSEAIAEANSELETFASNLLYANRQLAGGFSTGLTNANSLFEESVKIAMASRTGDVSQISGVLTAVSAITGAIAPDLTNAIVDAVVKAATGGNTSEIVALRSLAGINASNTEFLRRFAEDPQSVFAELFKRLASMQNMSRDNYMEVAEGLSTVFGLPMDTLARVDFNYLADAVSNMNVNNASLNENLALLQSGETTTNAELMKIQQINEYMAEEGLAYILDNEAARSIQEHMWDEQMKRDLQETTYAVDLQGSALDFLQGIAETVNRIMNILNPFRLLGSLFSGIAQSSEDATALREDMAQALELGKVGTGRASDFANLMATNKSLGLTKSLVSMLGGTALYGTSSAIVQMLDAASSLGPFGISISNRNPLGGLTQLSGGGAGGWQLSGGVPTVSDIASLVEGYGTQATSPTSRYTWRSKSGRGLLASMLESAAAKVTGSAGLAASLSAESVTKVGVSQLKSKIDKMLSDEYLVDKYVKQRKSFADWAASASSVGIHDLESAVEEVGYSLDDIKKRFADQQAEEGANEQERIRQDEWDFRTKGKQYWIDELSATNRLIDLAIERNDSLNILVETLQSTNKILDDPISKTLQNFFNEWTKYFIESENYAKGFSGLTKLSEINDQVLANTEDKDNAIINLAEWLTSNVTDLKDPAVQTNVLLAQILTILSAIKTETTTAGPTGFIDQLAALSMGLTVPTTNLL